MKTKSPSIYPEKEIEEVLENLYNDLTSKSEKIKDREPGLTIIEIHYFFFDVYKIKAIRGSSYIPAPEKYSNPKCGLINIEHNDQE